MLFSAANGAKVTASSAVRLLSSAAMIRSANDATKRVSVVYHGSLHRGRNVLCGIRVRHDLHLIAFAHCAILVK